MTTAFVFAPQGVDPRLPLRLDRRIVDRQLARIPLSALGQALTVDGGLSR